MEINMENKTAHTELKIKNKNTVTLDGVVNIIGFDPGYVSLETDSGRVTLEGSELKIESLEKSTGEILVTGKISGVFYSESKPKSGLSKWFG